MTEKRNSTSGRQVAIGRLRFWFVCAAVLACGLLVACGALGPNPLAHVGARRNAPTTEQAEFNAARLWAERLELAGLPNFHKVSDDLYRGAQPTAEGMAKLKELGVRTVVSLRSFHSDRDEIGETGLAYEHIYMKTWHPEDEEVVRFLQIVGDPNRTPVFVHCQRGADRTGMMCAIYRVAVQGWSKDEAIAEMTQGGFHFYSGFENLVDYVRELDIDAIKQRAAPGQASHQ